MNVGGTIGPVLTWARQLVVGSTYSNLSVEGPLGRKWAAFYQILNEGNMVQSGIRILFFKIFWVEYHWKWIMIGNNSSSSSFFLKDKVLGVVLEFRGYKVIGTNGFMMDLIKQGGAHFFFIFKIYLFTK